MIECKVGTEQEIAEWLTQLHHKEYILQQILEYGVNIYVFPNTYYCKALLMVDLDDAEPYG